MLPLPMLSVRVLMASVIETVAMFVVPDAMAMAPVEAEETRR